MMIWADTRQVGAYMRRRFVPRSLSGNTIESGLRLTARLAARLAPNFGGALLASEDGAGLAQQVERLICNQ
jgi:hypothetical protein